MINSSLTEKLIDYTKIHQWDGKLPTITGSSVPIINMETETTSIEK